MSDEKDGQRDLKKPPPNDAEQESRTDEAENEEGTTPPASPGTGNLLPTENQNQFHSGHDDRKPPPAVAADPSQASFVPLAVTTPPRSDRAQRLARKRDQLNEGGRRTSPSNIELTPLSASESPATPRTPLPPNTPPAQFTPPRTAMPGDNLVPSPAITSRARPAAPGLSNPQQSQTLPSGPLPPGPRLKGGSASNPQAIAEANLTPGAYQERARAIGELPSWARDGAANGTIATMPEPRPSATMTAVSEDIETSGLASAEPVTQAETVVYAEDIKEDELVQARRKFICFAIAAIVIIAALVAVLLVMLLRDDSKDICDLPVEQMTISIYCRCHDTAEGFLAYFNETDKDVFLRHELIKSELMGEEWMRTDADLSIGSCEHENMVLLSMTLHTKGLSLEKFESVESSLGSTYRRQMFAIQSLYFALNGDEWKRKRGWLEDPVVCSWDGIDCDYPSGVTAIRLDENCLRGTLPTYLSLAPALKQLDLSGNAIHGQIPAEFKGLSNLGEITLSNLNLNGTIPKELASLSKLHVINFSNNSLTGSLPPQLKKLRLFMLRLDHNALTGTLPSFGEDQENRRMQLLSVKNNNFRGTLPEALKRLSNLEFIDLSSNNFKGEPPDFLSASTDIAMVNLIDSGFSGPLPDQYCLRKSQVTVLANCRKSPSIQPCQCCQRNYTEVLKCHDEWDNATMKYVGKFD